MLKIHKANKTDHKRLKELKIQNRIIPILTFQVCLNERKKENCTVM